MCAKSTQCNNLYSQPSPTPPSAHYCYPTLTHSLSCSLYIMTLTIYCPRFVVYSDDVGDDDAAAAAGAAVAATCLPLCS